MKKITPIDETLTLNYLTLKNTLNDVIYALNTLMRVHNDIICGCGTPRSEHGTGESGYCTPLEKPIGPYMAGTGISPAWSDSQKCGKPIYVDVGDGMTCANPKGQCILHDVGSGGSLSPNGDTHITVVPPQGGWKKEIRNILSEKNVHPEWVVSELNSLIYITLQKERARLREKVKQLHGGGYIHHEEPFVSENGVLSLLDNDTMK